MIATLILIQTILLMVVVIVMIVVNVKFLSLLIEKDKKKAKPINSVFDKGIDYVLKNEPERVGVADVGLYEAAEKLSDDDTFGDVINAQMTIQEATNLVFIKNHNSESVEGKLEIDEAREFLDSIIRLSKDYKSS